MTTLNDKSQFIWNTSELLRDHFKRSKYQDVILPFTVLRRIDSVLEPTKEKVLETYHKLQDKVQSLDPALCKASGFSFYNISPYTFRTLLDDPKNLSPNLKAYISGFSPNMRDVLDKYDFNNTIDRLDEAGLLCLVMEKFNTIDLHPDTVSNIEMGYIFENLIRKFNEALNENPGEHFTPKEVVRLMSSLLIEPDKDGLSKDYVIRTIYDPCCGTGGMLTSFQNLLREINATASIQLFGQEVNPETFAVCKSDLYMKSAEGKEAENIYLGSTLSNDQLKNMTFDYMVTNPPYGKNWRADERFVKEEHKRGYAGRFGAGYPRINDGQLLFLQHMISKMKPISEGGSRIAIIMNGSPLFTGDAGSGESEIRRWIIENDWLEAIIALPEQLFYNTGIATYIWIVTNRKEKRRQGKIQLINAVDFWVPMRKSLGDKRREISQKHIEQILSIYSSFSEGEYCKIFNNNNFGYRKITIERPLRLNFQATPERIEQLKEQTAFINLAKSRKKDPQVKFHEESEGKKLQKQIFKALSTMSHKKYTDRTKFAKLVKKTLTTANLSVRAPVRRGILDALSQKDDDAPPILDSNGNFEPDSDLRDTEKVPLTENVYKYFAREVKPHLPDAWINEDILDEKDRQVGKVGYEINFNRYFYQYEAPRPLLEIETDIRKLEEEILGLLQEANM